MIKKCLIEEKSTEFDFKVLFYFSDESMNSSKAFHEYLAKKILNSLRNPDYLRKYAIEYGIIKLIDYIDQYVISDQKSTRIGDFGEIISSLIQIHFKEYLIPISKLRFREKKDWSMRLTDIFAIKKIQGNYYLKFIEVKTVNNKDLNIGKKAYDDLKKINPSKIPEIIEFVSRIAFDTGDYQTADILCSILSTSTNPKHIYEISLVHEEEIWNDEILKKIKLKKSIPPILVNIVLVKNLNHLISCCYSFITKKNVLSKVIK